MRNVTLAPPLQQLNWEQLPQTAPPETPLPPADQRMILNGTSSVAQCPAHLDMKTEASLWINFRTTPFTPAVIETIERRIDGELGDLDPDEKPPTAAASKAWRTLLLSVASGSMPLPIVSVPGQGGVRFTWREADRRLFLTIFPDGQTRQRQVEISEQGARGGRSIPNPPPHAVRQALAWLTGA